jgi:hypothetical protein
LNKYYLKYFIIIKKGKIEAEFKLMTEKEAEEHPAGKGRNEPDALPEPR